MSNWSPDDFHWYLKEDDPSYDLVHWWEIKGSEPGGAISNVDKDNETLYEMNSRKRPQIRVAPFLWEILRRHPNFRHIRRKYLSNLNKLPESGFDEYNERRIEILSPWFRQGHELIESLAQWGHLPWDSGDKLREDKFLSESQKELFEKGVVAFSEDERNFSDKRIAPAVPVLFGSKLSPSAEECVSIFEKGKLRPKTMWNYTLEEYKDQAERRGNALIVIEVSKAASSSTIVGEFKSWIYTHRSTVIGSEPKTVIRMRPDHLELIASLDRKRDLDQSEIKKLQRLFRRFLLRGDEDKN